MVSMNEESEILEIDENKEDLRLSFNILDFGDDLEFLNSPMISPKTSFVNGLKNSVISQTDLAEASEKIMI